MPRDWGAPPLRDQNRVQPGGLALHRNARGRIDGRSSTQLTGRRYPSRSSSGTARAVSARATSRRCSRPLSVSRPAGGRYEGRAIGAAAFVYQWLMGGAIMDSVGPVPAPVGTTNCCPEVRKASATEFELVNPSKQSNFILGELVSGGEVSFIVENLPKDGTGCPGKWMFDQMM